jgi:hypothetical protein
MAITTYTRNFTAATKTTLSPYVTNTLGVVGLTMSSGGNNSYSELGVYTGIDAPIPTAFGQVVRVTFRLSVSTSTGVDVASYVWYNGGAISTVSPSVAASPGNSTKDMTGIVSPWHNSGQPVSGLTIDMINSSTFGFGVGFFKSTSWNLGGTSNPIVLVEVDDSFSVQRRGVYSTVATLRTN